MSHTSTEALRTTMVDDQTGSKLERSACGTKRRVRAPARCEIAGVANPPVASAPAPAIALSTVRRCTMAASLDPTLQLSGVPCADDPPHPTRAQRPAMTGATIPV